MACRLEALVAAAGTRTVTGWERMSRFRGSRRVC
jgi:hypothetical protein